MEARGGLKKLPAQAKNRMKIFQREARAFLRFLALFAAFGLNCNSL